jgi:hypothetical protein
MNSRRILGLTWCLLTIFLPGAALAQGAVGSIVGVVRDSSGAVLPGATVEAASPALIEKVRATVSDDQGRYQITNLSPGLYTVTVSLTGFTKVVRTGIALTTGFAATVDADLAVGSLEETVTVSGEAPIVDTRNSVQQTTLQDDTLNELPTTRKMGSYAAFMPAAKGQADVGGLTGENGAGFGTHGGRGNEVNVNTEGFNVTMFSSRTYSWNPNSVEEVVVEDSGTSAEAYSGGIRLNVVPKDGGNRFAGGFNFTYTNPDLQSGNLSDDLIARHLFETPSVKQNYTVGGSFGGPIKRDKLWFFTAHRKWIASSYVPGNFYNKLNGSMFYEPDRSRPAFSTNTYLDDSLRLTWQASSKDKVSAGFSGQNVCTCPVSTSTAFSPEATGNAWQSPDFVSSVSWTRPHTSRLLLEGGSSLTGAILSYHRRPIGTLPTNISIIDSGLGITYGARAGDVSTGIANLCCYGTMAVNYIYNERFAVSYVTGTHAFKTGITYQLATYRNKNESAVEMLQGARQYTFSNKVPRSVRIFATPFGRSSDSTTIGLYAQDQWTIRKLTLNLGLRYDSFNATARAQHFTAGYFVPERNFPEVKNVPDWKNLDPRFGAAYDVFGNGHTAVKGSWGRYVLGTSATGDNGIALSQPILNQANQADRTWNDANGNYVPDCVLGPSVPEANGECGPISDLSFGQVREANANQRYLEETLHGLNSAQSYLWRGSVSIEHELRPGLGVGVGYFRTSYGGFTLNDNERVSPTDYDEYCITAPADPRLPGGGGNRICGLYDLKPERFGQVFNLVSPASRFGKQKDIFNGIDITMRARLAGDVRIQGGVATGSEVTDNCFVVDSPQQRYQCHQAPSWGSGTQTKFQVIYPLPWAFRASAIYQNVPGLPLQASYVATNAQIAPSLGRNLGSCRGAAVCTGQVTINLLQPNTVFEPRRNQVDLRFARTFKAGGASIEADLDLYNALNANSVLQEQMRYGPTWRDAQEILPGRLLKVGSQITF